MKQFEMAFFVVGIPVLMVSLIALGVSISSELAYRGALIGFTLIVSSIGLQIVSRVTEAARAKETAQEDEQEV